MTTQPYLQSHVYIIVDDEEERRQQRLKDFKKVIEIYCENLKSRTTQSTGHKKQGGK